MFNTVPNAMSKLHQIGNTLHTCICVFIQSQVCKKHQFQFQLN